MVVEIRIPSRSEGPRHNGKYITAMRRNELRHLCHDLGIEAGPDAKRDEMLPPVLEHFQQKERAAREEITRRENEQHRAELEARQEQIARHSKKKAKA